MFSKAQPFPGASTPISFIDPRGAPPVEVRGGRAESAWKRVKNMGFGRIFGWFLLD